MTSYRSTSYCPTSYCSTIDTIAGPFTVVVDADDAVLAAGWTSDTESLLAQVHHDLRGTPRPRPEVGAVTRAVRAYHAGDLAAPDAVRVCQKAGGPFHPAVWATLRQVAPGQPVSYSELAARTGRPRAVRAAAAACAGNAVALFVPCHRVIRSDGGLGGFRWGLEVKRWLIAHESVRQNWGA